MGTGGLVSYIEFDVPVLPFVLAGNQCCTQWLNLAITTSNENDVGGCYGVLRHCNSQGSKRDYVYLGTCIKLDVHHTLANCMLFLLPAHRPGDVIIQVTDEH